MASVTVNGNPANRLDEFFYKELAAGSGAIHAPYVVQATDANGTTTRSGGKFLPASPENFIHDFDGNLTSDGRFSYSWDAENRLVVMETNATVPLPARRKLAFAYDSMGRRIRKSVWHGVSGGGWQLRHQFDFIHELNGWNILAERSGGSTNRFIRTYAWGTDLSGTLTGAGGVGGLLFATFHTSGKTFAYGSDLNGNVTLLVNTATGQAAATYDYGPFGELLRQSGEYATLNPYRFSTKYTDDETGLLDYCLRYYDPSTGRWPSRDPIGEEGGINLYGMVANDPVNRWDFLGLKDCCTITLFADPPADQRAVKNNVLNVAFDTGHSWLELEDEKGKTITFSFGPGAPIGKDNLDEFKDGKLPGNAEWPIGGHEATAVTKSWDLDQTECDKAKKLIADKKKAKPNYSPQYQCTSAALEILTSIPVDPVPPSGVGFVIAERFGIRKWEGNAANPYHLSKQLGAGGQGGGGGKRKDKNED